MFGNGKCFPADGKVPCANRYAYTVAYTFHALFTCCTVVQSKVLRTTWSVNANKTTLYPSHSETLWPIDTIFGSINYALEMYKPTKFGADRLKGGAATRWWNITTLCIFSVCMYVSIYPLMTFFAYSTGRTARSIFIVNGFNDALSSKERPFGGKIHTNSSFGGPMPLKRPKIPLLNGNPSQN